MMSYNHYLAINFHAVSANHEQAAMNVIEGVFVLHQISTLIWRELTSEIE